MLTNLSLLFDALLVVLISAGLWFGLRLQERLRALREHEPAMMESIARFNEAAGTAAAASDRLRASGDAVDSSLRAIIEKAQALRDELAFLIERGERIADQAAGLRAPAHVEPARAEAARAEAARAEAARAEPARPERRAAVAIDSHLASASEMERDLKRAIEAARTRH